MSFFRQLSAPCMVAVSLLAASSAFADHHNTDNDIFGIKMGGRIQARLTYQHEGDTKTNDAYFSMPRVRSTLKGHALTKSLTYKLQIEYGKGFVSLKDAYANYSWFNSQLQLRVGQYKRPFARQFIMSSSHLQFADPSFLLSKFGASRDIGIAIHNGYDKSPTVEYVVGIFNGHDAKPVFSYDSQTTTNSEFTNIPTPIFEPMLAVRIGYNHGNITGYTEQDMKRTPLAYGVAASALLDLDADKQKDAKFRAEVDYILKYNGLSTNGAFYFHSTQDGGSIGSMDTDGFGYHLQVAYLFKNDLEPALRYSGEFRNHGNGDEHWVLAGLSWYIFGNQLKWQTDVGVHLNKPVGSTSHHTDVQIRSQLQLVI